MTIIISSSNNVDIFGIFFRDKNLKLRVSRSVNNIEFVSI